MLTILFVYANIVASFERCGVWTGNSWGRALFN